MNFTKKDYYSMYVARYDSHCAYRREGIDKDIWRGTFVEVFKDYDLDLKGLACFIPVLLLTYLPTVFERIQYNSSRPEFIPEEHFKLDPSKKFEYVENPEDDVDKSDVIVARRESCNSLNDNYCPDREKKISRAEIINNLRKYLYKHELILEGNKIGNKLTFGKDIDDYLKVIFNDSILNGSIEEIENKLKQLYQGEIKIRIVSNRINNKVKINTVKEIIKKNKSKEIDYELIGKIMAVVVIVLFYLVKTLISF